MEQRLLGHTDIKVSAICLGTMTFGEQNTAAEAAAQLDCALESGVNFIDTAEIYPSPISAETQGRTEEFIGQWLGKRRRRDDFILASKVAPSMSWIRDGGGFNRANITAALEDSLRRLKTDYVDLYQTHWPDRNTNFFGHVYYQHDEKETAALLQETLETMRDLQTAGKIRAFGVSNETPWGMLEHFRLAAAHDLPRPASVQNPYNLLNRLYETGMAEISIREQSPLLAYSPLGFGALSGKYLDNSAPPTARLNRWGAYYKRYTSKKAIAATADYATLAKKRGTTPAAMAIAFTVQQPFVAASIIGATSLTQLRENIAAADLPLDEEWRADIDALGLKHFNPSP